jgi:diguanylate cyclase (GGDEF)-like protein
VLPSSAAISTQRLAEFLAVVSKATDVSGAMEVAAERAARALEAEVAVVLDGSDQVRSSVGFALGRVPVGEIVEIVAGRREMLFVPGAGWCPAAVAPLAKGGAGPGHLLVARSGEDGFTVDEVILLRGLARVLDLRVEAVRTFESERRRAAENARLLITLQERQRLLEQLARIQRAITRREPLGQILDAITTGARELFGDDAVGLRMVDPDDPGTLLLVSSRGLPDDMVKRTWGLPVTERGVTQLAFRQDRLVVMNDYATNPDALPDAVANRMRSAMAAPVHEGNRVVGSLFIGSYDPTRKYADTDQEALHIFAEQVSLAVTDAKTHEAMEQAFHDSLTGLASRALFLDRLDHALARGAREGTRLAVLFVDLDRFKNVNDSLGHLAGDSLLVGVAERLRDCLSADDTAARLGGDEFAVVLEDSDEEHAVGTARHIIDRLRAPFIINGHEAFVDASVGIAFNTDGELDGQSLIRNADLAMYQAKKDGKGRYELFQPAMRAMFLGTVALEAGLRRALDHGDFVLHYQPIVELRTGRVVGLEALVRWQHPHRGLVRPPEFVPLAEETGLILAIDRWVLSEACRQVAEWNARRHPEQALTVCVNLSARQLQQADLPEFVAAALARGGLDPHRLVIEITESLLVAETEPTLARLHRLKDLGVRLAIDDFGTGYSSLAYLRQFPVDIIKIDKSFVNGLGEDEAAPKLARAIVQIGEILRLATVAEGIESAEQLAELRSAECVYGQGYFFAKPVGAAEMDELLGAADATLPAAVPLERLGV